MGQYRQNSEWYWNPLTCVHTALAYFLDSSITTQPCMTAYTGLLDAGISAGPINHCIVKMCIWNAIQEWKHNMVREQFEENLQPVMHIAWLRAAALCQSLDLLDWCKIRMYSLFSCTTIWRVWSALILILPEPYGPSAGGCTVLAPQYVCYFSFSLEQL